MKSLVSAALLAMMVLALPASAGLRSDFHEKPLIVYPDRDHPLSDTSVFSTISHGSNRLGRIISVDDKKTHCATIAGCPIWVRVLPGDHKIKTNLAVMDGGIYSYHRGQAEVTVAGMKPRHVYEARYELHEKENKFRAFAVDLGEDPEYGIKLGLTGKFYRVEF